MRPLRVAFRADASNQIGTGHVMRCLTLADRLAGQGAEVRFVAREHAGHLCDLIGQHGFAVQRLPRPPLAVQRDDAGPVHAAWLGASWREDAEATAQAIDDFAPDWLIVDHYAIDARWEGMLALRVRRIMVIDDLADRTHRCDLLLDQNLSSEGRDRYRGLVPAHCTLLIGPDFALLRQEYAELRRRSAPRQGPIKRVMVSFGGVDKDDLTSKTVGALLALPDVQVDVDIVIPAASPQVDVIRGQIQGNGRFTLHDRVPSLASLILAADLAVGAGGTTTWERLCLGLPAVVVTVADNQRPATQELSRRGLVKWLGDAADVSEAQIQGAIGDLLARDIDPEWSARCMAVIDGAGADRVAASLWTGPEMEITLRHAELLDEALLLDWANDPVVRANAFNPKPIAPEEHRAWFRRRLRQPDSCEFYIALAPSGIPLGQVRMDDHEGAWEISYSVAAPYRGRGVGRIMLQGAIETWRRKYSGGKLIGQVKPDNVASRKVLEALGFGLRSASPERLVFEHTYEE